jgi:adenine deaminase
LTAYGYFGDRKRGYDYWVDERKFFTPFARELTADRRQSNERFGKIFEIKLRTIKAFYDAGGGNLITLGTDHNSAGEYLPGFSAHRELHALVLAGIPPASALRIATINGARAMGLSDRLGTIEAGKLADMFVIKGNPLEQIRNTRSVHTVIKNGVIYDTGELLRSVEGRVGPEGPEELDSW